MQGHALMGHNFKESNPTDHMVVIEGNGHRAERHDYYNEIIRKLQQDPEHITAQFQDFWGDTLTAAGAQSATDGKAS